MKGITVYRDRSRADQVLSYPGTRPDLVSIEVDSAYAGGCAGRACEF